MIDELDLAFDESAERGKSRHRRRRGAGSSSKGRGGKSAVAFLMAFILLALLGGGAYLGYTKIKGFFTAADYDGAGVGTVEVQIADNASITDMGNTLVDKDVVKSTAAFVDAAQANPRGKNIRSGTYIMRKQMAAKQAVTLLLDPQARITTSVTIPEGKTDLQVYALLSKATKIPVKEFQTAAKNPEDLGVPSYWFNRDDHKAATKTIEGFLFPDTYEFEPKATAAQILTTMVNRFLTVVGQMDFADSTQKDLGVSPFEALIVASLSQAEAGTTADMPRVARVAYNRAYKKHMPLQFDSTANYWISINGGKTTASGNLTGGQLNDTKNPYNTVSKLGLPPGPIDSPGKAALQGALTPAAGNWLYFVLINPKTKASAFTDSGAQHAKNIQTACKNGVKDLC
jgi:UPF0755 protein